jgi:hypothetical protein
MFFMNALSRNLFINSHAAGWLYKCLQLSVSVSMETVFRNHLVSRNQSLRGNVFAHSFPRNYPYVTIFPWALGFYIFTNFNSKDF